MATAIRDNLTLGKPSHLTQDIASFLIAKQARGVSTRYLEFLRCGAANRGGAGATRRNDEDLLVFQEHDGDA